MARDFRELLYPPNVVNSGLVRPRVTFHKVPEGSGQTLIFFIETDIPEAPNREPGIN